MPQLGDTHIFAMVRARLGALMSNRAKLKIVLALSVALAGCASTTPSTAPDATMPPPPGCAPAGAAPHGGQSSLEGWQRVSYAGVDCSDLPGFPGHGKGDCPIDPNNPGGAQDKPCRPPDQS